MCSCKFGIAATLALSKGNGKCVCLWGKEEVMMVSDWGVVVEAGTVVRVKNKR